MPTVGPIGSLGAPKERGRHDNHASAHGLLFHVALVHVAGISSLWSAECCLGSLTEALHLDDDGINFGETLCTLIGVCASPEKDRIEVVCNGRWHEPLRVSE